MEGSAHAWHQQKLGDYRFHCLDESVCDVRQIQLHQAVTKLADYVIPRGSPYSMIHAFFRVLYFRAIWAASDFKSLQNSFVSATSCPEARPSISSVCSLDSCSFTCASRKSLRKYSLHPIFDVFIFLFVHKVLQFLGADWPPRVVANVKNPYAACRLID